MGKRKYWTAEEEKLQAILYVQSSNSVVQACRESGIDPSMYYKWKKAYEEKGEEGLRPKYSKTNPELERLKKENERLKKLLAKKELELEIAREFIKNFKNTEEKVKAIEEFMRKHPTLNVRKICRVLVISRSPYYAYQKPRVSAPHGRSLTKETYNRLSEEKGSDEEVVKEIEEILSGKFVPYRYRKVMAALRRKGYVINHKKVYRLMKESRLLLKEVWKGKESREKRTIPEGAEAPNKKWSIDIKHCKALNRERWYVIAVKDRYTKEVITIAVERKHTYQEVENVMYQAAERNGTLRN